MTPLEGALRDTLERNLHRPAIDFSTFNADKLPGEQRAALSFLISNMACIESTSTLNLLSIARSSPVPIVSACFAAQIHDELAHGALLERWIDVASMRQPPNRWTRFGIRAAAWSQQHTWLGIRHVEILTEHYASTLIEELLKRIEEPVLHAVLAQIQLDELRHKTIAIESLRALRDARADRSVLARIFGPGVQRGTLFYFRVVFGGHLADACGALGLPHREIYERSVDEVHDALRTL